MTRDPLELLAVRGGALYDGEPITQLEHGLQAAALARAEDAPPALIAAALLHDIGHCLVPDAGAASRAGRDLRHEQIGARYLVRHFGQAVSEPVRWHVAAKRWLARDTTYRAGLSAESAHTLVLQGGPMSDAEADAFLAMPGAADGIRLRRWDDRAKTPGLAVPTLASYQPLLAALRARPARSRALRRRSS